MTSNQIVFQKIANEEFNLALNDNEVIDFNIQDSTTENEMHEMLNEFSRGFSEYLENFMEDVDEEFETWRQEAGYA